MTAVTGDVSRSPWLVSRGFDLSLFFGGALLSLVAVGLALVAGVPIVILWWIWLLGFDGPHMMATYSRTYLDARSWRDRRALLLGSLASFLIGPALLIVSTVSGQDAFFLGFLGLATVYGYHHIIRQHYGFVALYKTKAGERSRIGFVTDKWGLYVGCWAPYFYFLFTHPKASALIGLPGGAPPYVGYAFIALWAVALAAMLAVGLGMPSRERSTPKLVYVTLTLLLHGAAYFWIARFEPVYSASGGPDEDYLLLSIMLTLFHNLQYVALVFIHNQSRYGEGGAGAASWASTSVIRFAAICAAFSVFYLVAASATGVFPAIRSFVGADLGGVSLNKLSLAIWWGIALHHYVLDQKIWRIKEDPELRRHLRVA